MKPSANEVKLSGLWARNYATIQQVCLRARFRAFPETGPWAVKQMVRRTGSEFSEKGKNPKLFRLLNFLFPRRVVVSLCSLLLYFDRRFVRRFSVGFSRVVALPFAISAGEINSGRINGDCCVLLKKIRAANDLRNQPLSPLLCKKHWEILGNNSAD